MEEKEFQQNESANQSPSGEAQETQQPTTHRRPRIGEARQREGVPYDASRPMNYQPRYQNYERSNYERQDVGYPHDNYSGYQRPQRSANYRRYNDDQTYQRPNAPHAAYQRRGEEGGYQRPQSYERPEGGYQRPRQQYQRGGYQNNYQRQSPDGYQRQPQGAYQRSQQDGYQRPQRSYQRPPQDGYGYQQQGFAPRGGYQRQQSYGQRGGYQRGPQGFGPQQRGYGVPTQRQRRPYQPRPVEYVETVIDPNEELRLNKYLANAGVCSRREADEYIQNGLVKVNGEVVTELGTKVTRKDQVTFKDEAVSLERKIYVLLNKPKDTVTTSDDPQGRQTVLDLVRNAAPERIYPVGRLDRNTTGVLLLTNDGDLASKLTHPKFVKKKIYHVWLDKDVNPEDLAKIAAGVELEDGPIHADAIAYANETDKNQVGIEIHSGKNRIVRRLFEHLGYRVVKLDRVYFAGLTKKNLPRGRWRHLTQQEVNMLKMGAFE